jgi:hypothetical protein
LASENIAKIHTLIDGAHLSSRNIETALGSQLEITLDELRGLSGLDGDAATEAQSLFLKLISGIALTVTVGQDGIWKYKVPIEGYYALNYLLVVLFCTQLPRWSVITLNYDEALDWAFRIMLGGPFKPWPMQYARWMDMVEYGRITTRSRGGIYAKLHGSLGLSECLNMKCRNYRKPLGLNANDRRFSGPAHLRKRFPIFINHGPNKCPGCELDSAPLLLPPGKNKSAEEGAFLEMVYRSAEWALAKSDNWLLLGYSFPQYDFDVRDLMKRAIRRRERANRSAPKLWVIAPDAPEIGQRVYDAVAISPRPIAATFSSFAQAIWPTGWPPTECLPVSFD